MTSQVLPLILDGVSDPKMHLDICSHPTWLFLTNVWFGDLHNCKCLERKSHPGPSIEDGLPILGSPWLHSCNNESQKSEAMIMSFDSRYGFACIAFLQRCVYYAQEMECADKYLWVNYNQK